MGKNSLKVMLAVCLTSCTPPSKPTPSPSPAPCTASTSFKIYNGDSIPSTVYPYVGALAYYTKTSEGLCTASLICPNVILTAAHCFYEQGPSIPNAPLSSYIFTANATVPFNGSASDSSNLPPDATQLLSVTIHPNWTGATTIQSVEGDMAIALLAKPFVGIPLAPLAISLPASPSVAAIMGYGESLQNDGSTQGTFGVGTKRKGAAIYEGLFSGSAGVITTSRQSGANSQDTCSGDSGSPLLVNGKDLGTLSGGDAAGCGVAVGSASQGKAYYCSAVNNAAWIQQQMTALGCPVNPPPCG